MCTPPSRRSRRSSGAGPRTSALGRCIGARPGPPGKLQGLGRKRERNAPAVPALDSKAGPRRAATRVLAPSAAGRRSQRLASLAALLSLLRRPWRRPGWLCGHDSHEGLRSTRGPSLVTQSGRTSVNVSAAAKASAEKPGPAPWRACARPLSLGRPARPSRRAIPTLSLSSLLPLNYPPSLLTKGRDGRLCHRRALCRHPPLLVRPRRGRIPLLPPFLSYSLARQRLAAATPSIPPEAISHA